MVTRAQRIDPAQVDYEGSDSNIIVGVSSVIGDQIIKQLAARVGALTLANAEKEDLDRWMYDRYQLIRKGASPALTSCRVFRTSTTGGAGTVNVGTRISSNVGTEYITTTPTSFGVSDLTSTCDVRASQAGKATQVGAGSLNAFADPSQLFDRSLQIINDEPAAGGEDAEEDDVFRARGRNFWRAARRGVLGAIEFGATTVAGVVSAQAIEALTSGATPARVVNLYISDSTGVASRALADLVKTALGEWRAGGVAVLVYTSNPLLVDIQLRLAFRANVDTISLTNNISAALLEFVNSIPVNGTLYVGDLYSVMRRYVEDGLVLNLGSIVAPVGDLVPTVGQTIRTELARITVVT